MSWYLPPYNMEVAIVVIVVFIVVLLLVIILVRICSKYNWIGCCCDSDADSVDDDMEEELNDEANNPSDCDDDDDDDVDERHPQVLAVDVGIADVDGDLEAGCYADVDDEEELTQGADYPGLSPDCPVFQGGKLQMDDEDGEEFLINKMEESLL